MREIKKTLEILLEAWRHYDDENDLARFEDFIVAAIRVMNVLPDYDHLAVLKAIFQEVLTNAESTDKGEHLHE